MHFLLGFLLGYYTRNKPLLAATLTIIALLCFVVVPAIALSGLYLSVRRERLSRPPQTRVPQLVSLDYKTAETTLHNSKLNITICIRAPLLPCEACIYFFKANGELAVKL